MGRTLSTTGQQLGMERGHITPHEIEYAIRQTEGTIGMEDRNIDNFYPETKQRFIFFLSEYLGKTPCTGVL